MVLESVSVLKQQHLGELSKIKCKLFCQALLAVKPCVAAELTHAKMKQSQQEGSYLAQLLMLTDAY